MANIKPGTYRIVNKRHGTAITIAPGHPGTIVGWRAPNQPNQKWLIQCSGKSYRIKDSMYGRYISPDSMSRGARVNLDGYPTDWEILPFGTNEFLIKLAGDDLVLDLHGSSNGSEIHVWQKGGVANQKVWKLEKLSDFAGNESENDWYSLIATKDKLITRLTEQLEQKDNQLATRDRVIQEQRKEIEQKEQQFNHMREELNKAHARSTGSNESKEPASGVTSDSSLQSEVVTLREKLSRLESLMNQWLDKENKRPNNMP
ncbi:hypothetical protein OPQ81_010589 [Rhizoctonia solani]|nr:hypothetical protein OPQ81_010589 [Rhizoctonia solani]